MHTRKSSLPSLKPPDEHQAGDEHRNEGPSRKPSGTTSSPKKEPNTSQTLRTRRGLKSKQPSQEDTVSGGGNPQQHSIHNRIGRSSSIEDSYWSRNWNSEGGRPKRERAFSDRPQSKRLLHRASVNSVGELIPFQRAPRDRSYETHLPHGKKTGNKKQIKPDDKKELLSLEQTESSKSNEGRSSNLSKWVSTNVPSTSVVGQKRQSIDPPGANILRNINATDNTGRPTRKQSIQEVQNHTGVVPKEPPNGLTRKSKITDANNKPEEPESYTAGDTGVDSKTATSNNVSVLELEQGRGDFLATQQTREEVSDVSVSRSTSKTSQTQSGEHHTDEESINLQVTTNVKSPSAEFKEAAAGKKLMTPSPPRQPNEITSVATHSPLNSDNSLCPTSSNSSDIGALEEVNSRQPNSIVRRGRDYKRTLETNPAQSSQLRGGQALSTAISGTNPTNVSVESSLHSPDVINASPRTNIAHPPTQNSSPSSSISSTTTSSQQGILNRFGRRIRVPSTSEPQERSEQPPQEEINHVSAEQTREQVSEPFEGTNHQRYRFFALSRDREVEDNRRISVPLTPNRDLLYGSTSPPLLRRHMRTHFDLNRRETSEGNQGSVSMRSSLGSSISDDDFLREDSFRTSSGGHPVFSPILQSGSSLDDSSSVPNQRRRLHEAGASISPRELSNSNSSPRLRSHSNSSPRELPNLNSFPIHAGSETDVVRSTDNDQETLTFSVDEGLLRRDARSRYQDDHSEAIPRLLPRRNRQASRELSRSSQIIHDVFGSSTTQRASDLSSLSDASTELQVPLFGSPLFAPLGVPPGMLLSLLVRTRREFGQEFMELLLENMMLNVLAHHLFETDLQGNDDGINGAPPPATQDIIDNLKETPALEMHIDKEMKCAICHSEYELFETLAELPCTHFFHPTCVAVWLKKSGTCPVCRFDLSTPTK